MTPRRLTTSAGPARTTGRGAAGPIVLTTEAGDPLTTELGDWLIAGPGSVGDARTTTTTDRRGTR